MRFKWPKSSADNKLPGCRAAAFISALVFSHNVLRYSILFILITFFIGDPNNFNDFIGDPNNFDILKAARFVNILMGVSASLRIGVAYMSGAGFSHFKILVYSVFSSFFGLLLFSLNLIFWGKYESIYIIGTLLLAVGEAGLRPLLKEFLVDQIKAQESDANTNKDRVDAPAEDQVDAPAKDLEDRVDAPAEDLEDRVDAPADTGARRRARKRAKRRVKDRKSKWWIGEKRRVKDRKSKWLIGAKVCSVVATVVISIFPWEVMLVSSAMVLVVTSILFIFGKSFYRSREIAGADSSLLSFIPVVKAALLKRHLNYPSSPDAFFQNDENQLHISPRVQTLRWLDKAAITESPKGRQDRGGRPCTVAQVTETKLLLKMARLWATFFVVGLVTSTGDTFSSEQGERMDHKDFTFYINILAIQPVSRSVIDRLYNKFLTSKRLPEAQLKLGRIMRMWAGMVLCIFFCAVAWRVEVHRLQIVDYNKTVPNEHQKNMTGFWLAPQYCLLGLMQGSSTDGLEDFIIGELPQSLKNYVSAMNDYAIDGIGSFLSMLFMYVNRNLFSVTLDESRLDKYYMRLMILSFVNMCLYYPISIIYQPIRWS